MNGKKDGVKQSYLQPSKLKCLLPDYPRTLHLSHNPNAQRDDLIASDKDCEIIFSSENIEVTEKVDAANCAMMLKSGNPIIRNRNHILNKGFYKATPAKQQFSSVWNYFYKNINKFEKINELAGFEVGVYGEWMFALHGIKYDKLPDLFIPYEIYDPEIEDFIDPFKARSIIEASGFTPIPLLWKGIIQSYEQLAEFCQEQSPFASERREGVYLKVGDGRKVTHRFKMVRTDFIQGCHWSKKFLTRNQVREL